MATPTPRERSVTRTYRSAIRIGEDYITLEETITLPIDASDEDVTKAVDLGWRMFQAQRSAAEQQAGAIREAAGSPAAITIRDPEAPASDKQRNYIATLQDTLSWSNDQISSYATEQSVDLVTMTKGQASQFIDGLKKIADDRVSYRTKSADADATARQVPAANGAAPATNGAAHAEDYQPINEMQLGRLEGLARKQKLDLTAEVQRRYSLDPAELSYAQGAELFRELQRKA